MIVWLRRPLEEYQREAFEKGFEAGAAARQSALDAAAVLLGATRAALEDARIMQAVAKELQAALPVFTAAFTKLSANVEILDQNQEPIMEMVSKIFSVYKNRAAKLDLQVGELGDRVPPDLPAPKP